MTSFTVTPTFEDYSAANRLARARAWSAGVILRSVLIMATAATAIILMIDTSNGASWKSVLPQALLWGACGSAFWLLLRFGIGEFRLGSSIRKTYDELGTVSLPTTYDFGETGFEARYEAGESRLQWSHIRDYVLSSQVLLLRRTEMLFFLIPLNQLDAGNRNALFSLIERSGVKRA